MINNDFFFIVETVLKKLDLLNILEKEMDLWYQTTMFNSSNINTDDISLSNVPLKPSDNLTNKISETIQNIKLKKQKDFYKSQIPKEEIKKSKNISSKVKKSSNANSPKPNNMQIEFGVNSDEEDIFVNSRKRMNNISSESLTPPSTSSTSLSLDISNSSCIKEKNSVSCSPKHTPSNTGQLARLKLSAFKFSKKATSNTNDGKVEPNIKPPSTQKQSDSINIFSAEDGDDLSYFDIE